LPSSFNGGRGGWRLPTQEELATLLDPTQSNPPLPAGHPFQGIAAGDQFWTASVFEGSLNAAYTIVFSAVASGDIQVATGADILFGEHRFWCVRGGSGAQNPIAGLP
jgi:hypothetical protein